MDLNKPDTIQWQRRAIQEQQEYYELLGIRQWIKFKPVDYSNLKRNIGFALFGPPEEIPGYNNDTGYKKDQLEAINKIFNLIKQCKEKHNDKETIWASFFFVCGKIDDTHVRIPVIRVPEYDITTNQNSMIFIDSCPRVYRGWQDYLNNNRLPTCIMCYPKNGMYSAINRIVEVEFGISPAGHIGKKVLLGADIAATIVSVATAGLGIATLFVPVMLPLTIGAVVSGGYSAGRSIQTLVDRGTHEQSIGLDNAESRGCWLGIGGSVMGIASGGVAAAAAKMAQAGESVALAGQIAMKSVTVGSCIVSGLGVANGLTNIIEKAVTEEEVTPLDVFQFSCSVLFFTGSVIATHQAYAVINNVRSNNTGGSPSDIKSIFSKISRFAQRTGNTVSGVIDLSTADSLSSFVIGSSSIITSIPMTRAFKNICSWVFKQLVEVTSAFVSGWKTMNEYISEVGSLLQRWWESWNEEIMDVVVKIGRYYNINSLSDLVIKGVEISEIANTVATQKRALTNIDTACNSREEERNVNPASTNIFASHKPCISEENACEGTSSGTIEMDQPASYEEDVMKLHAKLADFEKCKNPADFLKYLKFICSFVKREYEKEIENYIKVYEIVRECSPEVSKEEFDKKYGVSGNRTDHFFKTVMNKFRDDEGFSRLYYAYMCRESMSSGENMDQKFFASDGITILPFYNKERNSSSNGFLSRQQYYSLVEEITEQNINENNISIEEEGNTAVIQANHVIILVKSYVEDEKVSGVAVFLRP